MKEHYVIRKVGGQFVPEMQHTTPNATMIAAGGGALVLLGLLKRGLSGVGLAAVGGSLVYYGMTGHNPIAALMHGCGQAPEGRTEDTPSFARDDKSKAAQLPADGVDEAAMESFPASDPPARSRASA